MFKIWVPEKKDSKENEIKRQYNKLLERHKKAAEYMDNNKIPVKEREKYIPEYLEVLENINFLLTELEREGMKYIEYEVLEGFVVEG